ncbi:unnamed protein product, partial [Rangifer tarandus platyrhynchus]
TALARLTRGQPEGPSPQADGQHFVPGSRSPRSAGSRTAAAVLAPRSTRKFPAPVGNRGTWNFTLDWTVTVVLHN